MKKSLAWVLAIRLLFSPHSRALRKPLMACLKGIALSLVPLVLVICVSDGMIDGIVSRMLNTYLYHLQVQPILSFSESTYEQAREKIQTLSGVTSANLERQGFALAFSEHERKGVTLRALSEEALQEPGLKRYLKVVKGSLSLKNNRVLIGEGLAKELGLAPGDFLRVLTGKSGEEGQFLPRITTFVVGAIISVGYQELDKLWVVIPLERGFEIMSDEASRTFIGLKTQDYMRDLDKISESIYQELGPFWRVYSWKEMGKNQYQNFVTTKILLILIMSLIVLVALVSISSSLAILVIDRRLDIAILKSIGASSSQIERAFLQVAWLISLIGSVVGIGVGLFLSVNINILVKIFDKTANLFLSLGRAKNLEDFQLLSSGYYLEIIPIKIPIFELGVVFVATIFCSLIAAWLPSRAARKLRPIETFNRY